MSFDLKEFAQLKSRFERIKYARRELTFLGAGTARAVFLLNSQSVLKVSMNYAGDEQNMNEHDVSSDPGVKNIVARVIDAHPTHRWVIAENAHVFHSDDEFERFAKISWSDFCDALDDEKDAQNEEGVRLDELRQHPLVRATIDLINFADLTVHDLLDIEHWGHVKQRVVCIDYGLSVSTALTHNYEFSNPPIPREIKALLGI
jgi:hypothetical protein